MLLSYFTNYSMPDIWCLEVDKIILDKNLVKTEIFLQQCSLALVGTIN